MGRKILSLSLVFAVSIGFAAGCGNAETAGIDSAASGETSETPEIPVVYEDYSGAEFNILYRSEWPYEFIADEENGDLINDAVYKRNLKVESDYNINLNFIGIDGGWDLRDGYLSAVSKSILAGDGAYDLITGYQAYMITPAMQGYFENVYDVPGLDLSNKWWSERCNESLTVGGSLFMTTGDIALTLWDNMYVMYFNKKLAESYEAPDLYELVRKGEWTVDKLNELSSKVSGDIDGNTLYDENDLYGFLTSPQNHMRAYMAALEIPITTAGSDGYPKLCFNSERTQTALEKLVALHKQTSTYMNNKAISDPVYTETPVIFTEDRALFMSGYLGNADMLRGMATDFGIIPYPMLDANQDGYRTSTHNSVSMMCFPIMMRSPEMSGTIAEALCRESNAIIIPEYYTKSLKTKAARDDDSEEMIDLIRDSLIFDFGWVHSIELDYIGSIFDTLIAAGNDNFASAFASREAKVQGGLDKINTAYRKVNETREK